jgi:hypothetical protein
MGCSCRWPRIHKPAAKNMANMTMSTVHPSQVIGALHPKPNCFVENQYRGLSLTAFVVVS